MNIEKLLARLKNEASVVVGEKRERDGTITYILESHVSFFPMGPRHLWYALVVEPGQQRVEQEEINAILRHFWHGEIDSDNWCEA